MARRCYNALPDRFEDKRHEAMAAGLKALDFSLTPVEFPAAPGDVAIFWNLHPPRDRIAEVFRSRGGQVIVAEEGYTRGIVKYPSHFALALDGHNGSGRFPTGGPERWRKLGIELKPWREPGADKHILVAGQRGIGHPNMASPANWHNDIAKSLAQLTKRRIVIRTHPGKDHSTQPPLEDPGQLGNAHACVVWSSSTAVKALIAGIPVFYLAAHISVAPACRQGVYDIEAPQMDDAARLAGLERMAWMQWNLEEIASGLAFRHLLGEMS